MNPNRKGARLLSRLDFNAPVSLGFAAICLAALLLSRLTNGASDRTLFSVYRAPLTNPLTWLRMVCHVFGHSDWGHLLGNMMLILLLGPMLEEKYGSQTLVLVMLAAAFLTGLVNYIFFPHVMLMGASGIAFAMILLAPFTGARDGMIPVTFILVALMYIGQQVWQAVVSQDNISQTAHIVGGVVGAGLGFALNRSKGKRRSNHG